MIGIGSDRPHSQHAVNARSVIMNRGSSLLEVSPHTGPQTTRPWEKHELGNAFPRMMCIHSPCFYMIQTPRPDY